jgi:hypothetical protein
MKIGIEKGIEIAKEIIVRENWKGQSCKNWQSRTTGNIEQTKHRTKTKSREYNVDIKISAYDAFLE